MSVTKARRRVETLEPQQGSSALLHGSVTLRQQTIGVARRLVGDGGFKLLLQRTGLGHMAIRSPWRGLCLVIMPADSFFASSSVRGSPKALMVLTCKRPGLCRKFA